MKHKLQDKINFQGLSISVENKKGSYRSGTDPDGKPWKTKMLVPYGYILGVLGVDKDHLDCFVGDDRDSELVFVVNQIKPWTKNKQFDEHKVLFGFTNKKEAKEMYLKHYDSPKYFGSIKSYTMEQFKDKIGFDKKGTTRVSSDTFNKSEIDELSLFVEIEKAEDNKVVMSFQEFKKEHKRLIKRLKKGKKKDLKREAKLQEEEYQEYEDKLEKSVVFGHLRKTKKGKLTTVKKYNRANKLPKIKFGATGIVLSGSIKHLKNLPVHKVISKDEKVLKYGDSFIRTKKTMFGDIWAERSNEEGTKKLGNYDVVEKYFDVSEKKKQLDELENKPFLSKEDVSKITSLKNELNISNDKVSTKSKVYHHKNNRVTNFTRDRR